MSNTQIDEIILSSGYSSLVTSIEDNTKERDESIEVKNETEGGRTPTPTTPLIRKTVLNTDEYLRRLTKTLTPTFEILPENCRYVEQMGPYKVLVLEEQPAIRTIYVNLNFEAEIERFKNQGRLEKYGYKNFLKLDLPYNFNLSFPYIVHILRLNMKNEFCGIYTFYRLHPITGMQDYLIQPNLLNISSDSKMCLGRFEQQGVSLKDATELTLERFWSATYNEDYIDFYQSYQENPDIPELLTWQYNTRVDPMFIFDVEWKMWPKTLGQQLQLIRNDLSPNELNGFGTLKTAFSPSGITLSTEKDKNGTVFSTTDLESKPFGKAIASIGDELIINEKKHYINGFIANKYNGSVHAMQVEDVDGVCTDYVLTKDFCKEVEDSLKKANSIASCIIKNKEFTIDELVQHNTHEVVRYKRITNIRTARDGTEEICLNQEYYILDQCDISKFSEKDLKVSGIKLRKGGRYIFINKSNNGRRNGLLHQFTSLKFKEYSTVSNSLGVRFTNEESDDQTWSVDDFTNNYHQIITKDQLCTPDYYKLGMRVFTNLHVQEKVGMTSIGLLASNDFYERVYRQSSYNHEIQPETDPITIRKIFNQETKILDVPSFDGTIHFEIGDVVVHSNWDQPEEMVKIRRIKDMFLARINEPNELRSNEGKIFINESADTLMIRLDAMDGTDITIDVPYVSFQNEKTKIQLGIIRHISPEYNGIEAGTKIKSKVSGLSCFPKKDVNQIIGFITDSGSSVPYALCSNLCTIWADTIESNFTIIKSSDSKYSGLVIEPIDVSKIKAQPGDIFHSRGSYNTDPEFISFTEDIRRQENTNTLHLLSSEQIENNSSLGIGYTTPRQLGLRYGFITPRYTQKQWLELPRSTGYPNFHGGMTKTPNCSGRFIDDWRE